MKHQRVNHTALMLLFAFILIFAQMSTSLAIGSLPGFIQSGSSTPDSSSSRTTTGSSASCGVTWEVSQRFADLHAVAYGAGLYVAVGDYSALMTSPDGITWTGRDLGLSDNGEPQILSVIWNGSLFVAVGSQNAAFTSPDGLTWTPHPLDDSYSLRAVTWGNDRFVAVGLGNQSTQHGGVVLTSPDGLTWMSHTLDDAHSLRAVTWGNGLFVAVGSGNTVLTSPDGLAWTPRPLDDSYSLQAVTWGNGLFVAVGSGNAVLTSLDGITWTPRAWASAFDHRLNGVIWDGSQFAAIGYSILPSIRAPLVIHNVLVTSSDGVAWVQQYDASNLYHIVNAVTWSDGLFVAVGSGNAVLTSPDGLAWTRRTASTSGSLVDISWGHDQFVAVGYDTILTSPDGLAWADVRVADPLLSLGGLCAVAWGNGQFVVASNKVTSRYHADYALLTSPDGMTWRLSLVESYHNFEYAGCAVTWGDGRFVAMGIIRGEVLTSPDGVTWTSHTTGIESSIADVAWGDGRFVAVGWHGDIFTSVDGVTWTPSALHNSYSLNSVTWGNGQFVAVGHDHNQDVNVILTSPDGMTWTPRALDLDDGYRFAFSKVIGGNDRFVAVGMGYNDGSEVGAVLISLDGIEWTLHTVGTGYSGLEGIAWNGSQLIAVGDRIILRSDCSSSDDPATTLITHYYVSILERTPEPDGLAFWQGLIADRQARGEDVKPVFRQMAEFFFFSPEYLGRNTPDRQFITNLYLTFFQRTPDEGGYAWWLDQLARGMTRHQAMGGFLHSPEFTNFMERTLNP